MTQGQMETKVQEIKFYTSAISIDKGVITLIEPNGSLGYYLQRGIKSISKSPIRMKNLIKIGKITKYWENYKELPKNYKIRFEDESTQGKARVTFKE